MKNTKYEIRLSRVTLSFYALVMLIALGAGIAFSLIFGAAGSNPLWYVFYLFMVGIPALGLLLQVYFLVNPPRLLTVTDSHLTFATGLMYKQFPVDLKHVSAAKPLAVNTASIDMTGVNFGSFGLTITLADNPDVPSFKATSIGVVYAYHKLNIGYFYMIGRNVKTTIQELNSAMGKA